MTGRICLPLRGKRISYNNGTRNIRISADGGESIVVLNDGSSSTQRFLRATAGIAVAAQDGTTGYSTTNGGNTIDAMDLSSLARSVVASGDGSPNEIALLGKTAYVSNSGGSVVTIVDTASGSRLASVPVGSGGYGIAAKADGSGVYVANNSDSTVSLIDVATNRVTKTIPVAKQPECLAMAPDGRLLYVDNVNAGSISVIETATDTVEHTSALPDHGGRGLAVRRTGSSCSCRTAGRSRSWRSADAICAASGYGDMWCFRLGVARRRRGWGRCVPGS